LLLKIGEDDGGAAPAVMLVMLMPVLGCRPGVGRK
jgi:hypothetical protein